MAAERGLAEHWTFDAGAGDKATAVSASGRKAVIHGAVRAPGRLGEALRFDGKDDYVELGDVGEFDAFTLAFWLRIDGARSGKSLEGLVSSDAWEQGVFHVALRNGRVDVCLHLGKGARAHLTGAELRPNAWHHVAVTGDRRKEVVRLFTNGVEEQGQHVRGLKSGFKLVKQVVGRENGERCFRGMIDDVRFYSRALSPEEVRALCPDAPPPAPQDQRNIRTGRRIPAENYCDQPYVVVTKDGNWLCTLTTGVGSEGKKGQHVVCATSRDEGRTWSELVDIEPADGPEASWVVPLVTPAGRVYAFYSYNGDDVRTLRDKPIRVDMLGWYAFRYSDDNGRTWSQERYRIPMRVTDCDRANDWKGDVQIFWGIDKPKVMGGCAYFAFTKLGRYMLDDGEGWLYRSPNILEEADAESIRWELLPDGENGIRSPEFGSVQEEHNMVPLNDGKGLYCVYRTTTGYPCHAYSRDGGRTWTKPEHMTCAPGGRKMKNPRACPKLWKTRNGRYLFWFHNHSGKSFTDRNPAWIAGGIEKGGFIHWSEPEIVLYDPDVGTRMSYPDLVEQDGRYWISETNKSIARVHEIPSDLLEGMWRQAEARGPVREGLSLELGREAARQKQCSLPGALKVERDGGMAVEFWITPADLSAGQVIVDCRDAEGNGFAVTTAANGSVMIELGSVDAKAAWQSDSGLLSAGKPHHVAIIVDAGPKIIMFVVDGVLCDGGGERQYGWGRYEGMLGDVTGSGKLTIAPSFKGELHCLRVYSRCLRVSEAVANYRSGL